MKPLSEQDRVGRRRRTAGHIEGEKAVRHPYEAVSFIKLGRKKGGGYWCVEQPPADYGEAWHYGEDRALELMQAVANGFIDNLGFVLNQIAGAQDKFREYRRDDGNEGQRGAVFGFWRAIGWFAADAAGDANFPRLHEQLRDRRAQSKASLIAEREQRKREVAQRATRAAKARWAKKAA
jgi:hypothetical protein